MKKIRLIIMLPLIVVGIVLFYVGHEYHVFRTYKSLDLFGEESRGWENTDTSLRTVENPILSDWNWGISNLYRSSYKVPSWKEFYNYVVTDSAMLSEFPGIMPKQIRAKDFVITTDSVYWYYLWLFSGSLPDSANILYSDKTNVTDWNNMTFMDFLLRRSILVGVSSLWNICGNPYEMQIVLNKKRIQDAQLEARFRVALYKALSGQGHIRRDTKTSDVCCLHIYFKDRLIHVDALSDSCAVDLTASVSVAILSEFKYVTPDYHKYEFYFSTFLE